ncbi:MAG: hypothetical protein JW709_09010 [Sedimentisphaerales bacterium]|nr:hypothetical protein [Sedimentisphaerales bacterium]
MKRQDLDNLVSRFDDEALSPQEKQHLESELKGNPDAQKLRTQYHRLNEALERFSTRQGAVDLSSVRQSVLAQAARENLYPAATRLRWRRWSAMAAIAALVAIALVAWQFWPQAATTPTPPALTPGSGMTQSPLVTNNTDEPKIIVTLAVLPEPAHDQTETQTDTPALVLCWSGDNEKPAKVSNGKDQSMDDFSKMFF